MAYEYHRPSTDRLVNTSSFILTLWATRNEIIGWGPHAADAIRGIGAHWGDALALGAAGILVLAGYWKRIVGLAGFQEHVEPPAPRFPTDEALKAELHKWLQVPEHGVKDVATKDERVSFAIEVTDPQKRIVTFSKLKDAPVLAVSARATASDTSAPTVAGMDNLAYRSMQGDIGIELARAGVSFDARWIVKGRDDPKNAESDDQPGIGFQRNIVVNDNLTAEMVLREHNLLVRLLIVVIVVMNKYVRQEEARLGNVNTPLAVIPPSEITTETGR